MPKDDWRAARGGGDALRRISQAACDCGGRRCAPPVGLEEEGARCIVQRDGSTIVYEALLTQSGSLERVQAMRRRIEQVGGALYVERTGGAILVTLILPAPYSPEQFYPDMPFFPV